ncbi:uncharacterized protein FPRO_03955 [Fusarium proliferatum ET1]|uniref:Uncharacterized protein n=1 Tax=Fusarium proliferatum (strain ET1) TaxID=1227346 RepID=A0A1L7W803_FUSPR|nr:uncharacterized protein FPRO_03955 [Fusarium proliferatum ET1]CZR48724.1 uncharacterized protein FPRO_03955 [Fusarium proliferatum ET1]
MSQYQGSICPTFGALPIEQYLLRKWDSTSSLPTNQQRDQLIQAFLREDDISAFTSSTLDVISNGKQKLIHKVIVPWRSQKLRRIAEKYLPGNNLYEKLVVLRTFYGGVNDDAKFRRWIYDAAAAFETILSASCSEIPKITGGASSTMLHSSILVIRAERTYIIAEVKEEVSAVVTSRESEEDDYEDAIAHVSVSSCWLLVFDRESFEDEEVLLVFREKSGNVVRQSSIKPGGLEHIPHYIMRGSITESGIWRDAEVGEKYKSKGKTMREILPGMIAEAE